MHLWCLKWGKNEKFVGSGGEGLSGTRRKGFVADVEGPAKIRKWILLIIFFALFDNSDAIALHSRVESGPGQTRTDYSRPARSDPVCEHIQCT